MRFDTRDLLESHRKLRHLVSICGALCIGLAMSCTASAQFVLPTTPVRTANVRAAASTIEAPVQSVSVPVAAGTLTSSRTLGALIQEALAVQEDASASDSTRESEDDSEPESETESDAGEESEDAADSGESLAPLQNRKLAITVRVVDTSIEGIGTGAIPEGAFRERQLDPIVLPDGMARGASAKCVHWRPSLIQHHPLIFEDAMLERHGHSRWGHFEPVASGGKFFAAIALHPYLNTLNRPWDCQYALGHYRPGTCAPTLKNSIPYDRRAATVQGLTLGGLFWGAPLPW